MHIIRSIVLNTTSKCTSVSFMVSVRYSLKKEDEEKQRFPYELLKDIVYKVYLYIYQLIYQLFVHSEIQYSMNMLHLLSVYLCLYLLYNVNIKCKELQLFILGIY